MTSTSMLPWELGGKLGRFYQELNEIEAVEKGGEH